MVDFISHEICRAGQWSKAIDLCILGYDERFLRRKVIKTFQDKKIFVDFKHTTSLNNHDAFVLEDGRKVEVIAAEEPLYAVTGNLVKLGWHIGNRHTPCQIEADRLIIQRDPVIEHMLKLLGANVVEISEPFTPEGGAYGYGRTHRHKHGVTAHDN